jgi:hypothetical protein
MWSAIRSVIIVAQQTCGFAFDLFYFLALLLLFAANNERVS